MRRRVTDGMSNTWLQTHLGKRYYFFNPKPADIEIEDIAHALSLQCRFNGHCSEFYCPTLDQRILTADLNWVPAGEINVGDELVAFDEEPFELGSAGKRRRRFRPSVVTHADTAKVPTATLIMEDESHVSCSLEHPWLVATKLSRNQKWMSTKDLMRDLSLGRKRYMHKFFDTWDNLQDSSDIERSWLSGWLAGMAEGEGFLSFGNRKGVQCGISQIEGDVFTRICTAMDELGFRYSIMKKGGTNLNVLSASPRGGWRSIAEMIGSIRSKRLIDKFTVGLTDGTFHKQLEGKGPPLRIKMIIDNGDQEVRRLETSTHTYFCEGFGAHNSVAQHSVLVSNLVTPRLAMQGLMHDAAEAYVGDMISPIKSKEFKRLEEVNLKAIFKRFEIEYPLHPDVEHADRVLLVTEARDIMGGQSHPWNVVDSPLKSIIKPQSPADAKKSFLAKFNFLRGTN